MNKKILQIVVLIIIIAVIGIIAFFIYNLNQKRDFFKGKETEYALGDIINYQKQTDEQIQEYMQDTNYTLENPKIMVNPYGLTPLTALIIFTTEEETEIQVQVNGNDMTTVEKDTVHAVPIYGMYAGYDNVIKLTDEQGNSQEYTITTQEYDGDLLQVEISDENLDDSLYFLSPNFVENCIYDKEGNLLWYIEGDYAGDIKYLDNGHFYISDPYQGTNGVKINYAGFLEMDYLGKIYKQYITPYGYHHEIVQLDDNKILTLGANDDSDFLEAVLYIMDLETGEVTYYLDMYEFLHNIAPEWIESLGNDFDFVLNSAYYDQDTGDVVISCRGIGVIMRLNLETEEIKWMFGDPNNLPSEFDEYLLTVTDDTKYPYGQHSVFITEEGYIGFHNNDADQFNMESEELTDYLDNYTTNVIVEVDEENMTVHTIWEYDADQKEFSKVGGKLEILSNGNTLINYGWSITQEAYENPEGISIDDTDYLNGVVVELDENNNVLFRATTTGLIYRVYKTKLYEENTDNYKVSEYKKIDGTEFNGEEIQTSTIESELINAEKYDYEFEVQINRMMLTLPIVEEDSVDVIFVGEDGKSYIYNYKETGEEVKEAFNSRKIWSTNIYTRWQICCIYKI